MEDQIQQDLRIKWIDILKGMGIILVVLGHTKTPMQTIIYSFHMPLFFLLGGVLFNYQKYSNSLYFFAKRKFTRLVIPYFVSTLIIFFPLWYFLGRHYGENVIKNFDPFVAFVGIFYATGIDCVMPFNLPLWFLPCMFVALIVFWYINKLSDGNYKKMFAVTTLLAVLGYGVSFLVKLPWSIDVALVVQVFIFVGVYLNQCNFDNHYWLLPILALAISVYVNGRVDTAGRCYGNLLLYYIGGISGTILLIKSSIALSRVQWCSRLCKLLSFCGQNSLMILLFHGWGFKFLSAFWVFAIKMPLQEAQATYWPIYFLLSLIFCFVVICLKKRLDVKMSRYYIWRNCFAW